MTAKKLYNILFGMEHLPTELQNEQERIRLAQYLDSIIGSSQHTHTQLLFSAGQEAEYIYFVEEGLARGYNYDAERHREDTVILWDEGSIFTDPSGFFKKRPADLNVEVMSGSILRVISHKQLLALYEQFAYANVFTACMASRYTSYFIKRSHDLVSLSAWERYQELLLRHPGIEQKVTKEMIASYINVAPQSLSRILKENRGF
ncbi:Crp/Fnr family transcriptional regulator [Pedobacter sp. ISL-68]|uniref:Crp/Fnr family transcriptional regulator n=1 Tax=unclassified Pedobacter TaxID=2628915 RepID=UPI001BE82111|nr:MULTISPECIES: Crp/Fnr family transcriptional regulator [unclassified Pedobacter]MBT2560084.1 Crp/Fnr family transcriptional regulator [Pedobacter sp. ISL-64]MBT2589063.1 Crp/Fnr family transcriptional regulator [Pedobacter sp. ISL-68]